MKKRNQIFAGCLAAILLCCGCSAQANRNPQRAGTTIPNTAAAVPIAQQGSGFTDVTPGAWYEDAANW